MSELKPLSLMRKSEKRLAIKITVAVWIISSLLFLIPVLVAGEVFNTQMAFSLVAIAFGGSLVSYGLMLVIWRVFESDMRHKIIAALAAIISAAVVLTLLDLAFAKLFVSIQPGALLRSGLVFRATNNFVVFIPHFGLLGALYALLAHNRRAVRRERLLAEANLLAQQAKLSALRYQLNPHFLFNTLNSISSLVLTQRNADAEEMLGSLSEFLRTTLTASPDSPQTLEGELETIDAYLGIERIRFRERLGFDVDCPDHLRDAHLPQFLLQPLVENAIKYGVAPTEGGVTIVVEVKAVKDVLEISVRNDALPHAPSGKGAGVGLQNVRERLETLFGERGSLDTHHDQNEYRAVVRLPLIME